MGEHAEEIWDILGFEDGVERWDNPDDEEAWTVWINSPHAEWQHWEAGFAEEANEEEQWRLETDAAVEDLEWFEQDWYVYDQDENFHEDDKFRYGIDDRGSEETHWISQADALTLAAFKLEEDIQRDDELNSLNAELSSAAELDYSAERKEEDINLEFCEMYTNDYAPNALFRHYTDPVSPDEVAFFPHWTFMRRSSLPVFYTYLDQRYYRLDLLGSTSNPNTSWLRPGGGWLNYDIRILKLYALENGEVSSEGKVIYCRTVSYEFTRRAIIMAMQACYELLGVSDPLECL